MRDEFQGVAFPSRHGSPLAITNVSVLPMDGREILHNQTVVIDKGLIQTIAPAAQYSPEDGISIVDGSGRFLMPGLADMFTHYRDPAEAPLYLAYGITTARAGCSPFQLEMGKLAAAGEFPSPHMIAVTPPIDGIGKNGQTDMPGCIPLTHPEEAEAIVRRLADMGYRHVAPFSFLTRELLDALCKAADRAGLQVVGNCPNGVSWEEAIEAGMLGFNQCHLVARGHMQDTITWNYWDRFDPVPGTLLDFEKIRRLAGLLAEKQVWNLPTLVFHRRATLPVEIARAHPSLKYVPQTVVDDWEATIHRWGVRGRMTGEAWRDVARIRSQQFEQVVRIFHEEGAPQLTCTDGLNPYNVQGDTLIEEIEIFASAGMGNYGALKCATSEAARFMGEQDVWGTVATGKRADLILLDANPLEDLSTLRRVEAVFVSGYHLDRKTLDGMLAEREVLASQGGHRVPAATLTSAPAAGEAVADEGRWTEELWEAAFGGLAYRHTQLKDGNWLIEETYSSFNPRRHPTRVTSRLILDPKLYLLEGTHEEESFAGTTTVKIKGESNGGYAIECRSFDGQQSCATLDGGPRVPGRSLAQSIIPLAIRTHGETSVPTLDINSGAPERSEMAVAAEPTGESTEWVVTHTAAGSKATARYRLHSEGKLSELKETTVLLWPRKMFPAA